jgi:hypothetical protein
METRATRAMRERKGMRRRSESRREDGRRGDLSCCERSTTTLPCALGWTARREKKNQFTGLAADASTERRRGGRVERQPAAPARWAEEFENCNNLVEPRRPCLPLSQLPRHATVVRHGARRPTRRLADHPSKAHDVACLVIESQPPSNQRPSSALRRYLTPHAPGRLDCTETKPPQAASRRRAAVGRCAVGSQAWTRRQIVVDGSTRIELPLHVVVSECVSGRADAQVVGPGHELGCRRRRSLHAP